MHHSSEWETAEKNREQTCIYTHTTHTFKLQGSGKEGISYASKGADLLTTTFIIILAYCAFSPFLVTK